MFEKYQVNSYPEKFLGDNSDINVGKVKSILANKKTTYINPKKYLGNSFQPESIYKMENDNISGYQLDLKSSCRDSIFHDSKYNMTERGHRYNNYKKSGSLLPQENMEEMDSCYSSSRGIIDKYLNNNKINSLNKKINKDKLLNQTDEQIQKRRIKSIQSKFNVQKRDNFNVLSYRPEEDETNLIKLNGKIIQIFKKQDVGELFIPSNRIQTPLSSTHSSVKKEGKLLSCQNPALKFQSFFGTFVKPKHNKITKQAKSLSKIKLEDYNIDKLIEIGDNYENKLSPILCFGKKLKTIKNKMKLKNNKYSTNSKIIQNIQKNRKVNTIENTIKNNIFNENGEKNGLTISKTNEIEIGNNGTTNEGNNNNGINNKVISTKKIVYHGQIKRKRNIIKNAKTYNNYQVKEIINNSKYNGNNGNENPINNKNIKINNIKKDLDNNINKNGSTSSKIKKNKLQSRQKIIDQSIKNNKSNESQIQAYQGATLQVNSQRKNIIKNVYSFNSKNNNFQNVNNISERNKSVNNTTTNGNENRENIKSIVQSELPGKILLTESQILHIKEKPKNNNNIKTDINGLFAKNKSSIKLTEGEQYARKNSKNNNNGIINSNNSSQIIKKVTKNKDIRPKNYYGYDSYNMEGCINNHSYYVSVYSRKKDIQKNNSLNKIN